MKITKLLSVFLFIAQVSIAQTREDTLAAIEKIMSQYHAQDPGCQLSVSRNGQVVFSKAWGMADLELNVPLSTNSIFEAGSVSKQFTGAAILLLEQQGKLLLDDDVRKYVTELPDYGTPITLRQMLHHTSGIKDWGSIAELTGWPRGKKFYTNEDALEILTHQKTLNNKPGDEFLYSNSNCNLFGIIVQRVSGLSLAAFTKKYIFEPAGMTHSQWRNDPDRIVPNRAIAYSKMGDNFKIDMPNEYVYGQGGLLTTTEDLLKWNDFYLHGKLGTPSLLGKQTLTEPLNNGVMNVYAAGLFIKQLRGWYNISHNGATASYRCYLDAFPELDLSIAILSNTSQYSINTIAAKVRNIFVKNKEVKKPKDAAAVNISAATLNTLAGMYKNERDASAFYLSVKDNQLILDGDIPLTTVSETTFQSDNFLLYVKDGKGMYVPFSPRDSMPFTKMAPAYIAPKDMANYAGRYFSEETNSYITIFEDNGKLIMQLKAGETYLLISTYKDAFKITDLDCDIEFTRDAQNHILLMKMYVPRARNVVFKKVQ